MALTNLSDIKLDAATAERWIKEIEERGRVTEELLAALRLDVSEDE